MRPNHSDRASPGRGSIEEEEEEEERHKGSPIKKNRRKFVFQISKNLVTLDLRKVVTSF
jgi:hypothetical protein